MSIEQNKNLVKQGHELAVLLGTLNKNPEAASLVQRLAAQLDITTVALREMTKQRDALAAESVGLTEQAEEVYAAGYNHGHLNTVDGIAYADCVKDDFYGLAVELMREAETPAMDAFLREVRAQGAEACVKALVTSDDDDFIDAPNICANVAAELRQGGAA